MPSVLNNIDGLMNELRRQQTAQKNGPQAIKKAIAMDGQDVRLKIQQKHQEFVQEATYNKKLQPDELQKMLTDVQKSFDDAMTAIDTNVNTANSDVDKQLAQFSSTVLTEIMNGLSTASNGQHGEANKVMLIPTTLYDNINALWTVFKTAINDANAKVLAPRT